MKYLQYYVQKQHVEANGIAMRAIALHVKDLSSYIHIGRLVKLCSIKIDQEAGCTVFFTKQSSKS